MNMPALLIKYGEIALRGGNRKIYEDMLLTAVRSRLSAYGNFNVRKDQGRFFAESVENIGPQTLKSLAAAAAGVFGVTGVSPCVMTDDMSLSNLRGLVLAHVREHCPNGGSFKVYASRADKTYPMTSGELAADLVTCKKSCLI